MCNVGGVKPTLPGGPRVRGQPSPNLPGPRVRSFGGVCNVGAG